MFRGGRIGGGMNRNAGWRGLAAAAALMALFGVADAPEARAQLFPPLGAASPGEIATRLKAQGFVLTAPLTRRDTVYLADVRGPKGRERLVLDAWSGAILQSFVSRGRNWRPGMSPYVTGGGEFDSPPPLGPPPTRDFYGAPGSFAYGSPDERGAAGPDSQKPHKRPAKNKPAEAKASPEAPAPEQQGASTGPAPGQGPATAAAPAGPATEAQPNSPSSQPAMAESQRKPPAPEKPAAAVGKPGDKKVNDVPVNTLE